MKLRKLDAFLSYNPQDRRQAIRVASLLSDHGFTVCSEVPRTSSGAIDVRTLENLLDESTASIFVVGGSGILPWVNDDVRDSLRTRAREENAETFRSIVVVLDRQAFRRLEPTLPIDLSTDRAFDVLKDEFELRRLIGYLRRTDRLTPSEADAKRRGVLDPWRAAMQESMSTVLPRRWKREQLWSTPDATAPESVSGSTSPRPENDRRPQPKSAALPGQAKRIAGPTPPAERALALLLLIACAPIIAALALWVMAVDGRPAFHRGVRLGYRRRPFEMLKLRTLRRGASRITGGEVLNQLQDLTIPGGRLLRDTRLDELPQLWNLVRGEMSFVGPRPERPEVYALKCSGIPGYERRFDVAPGLIGLSQLFTPRGTPKRYRTLIDNSELRSGHHRLWLVLYTGWVIALRSLKQLWNAWRTQTRFRSVRERRRMRRIKPHGAVAYFSSARHLRRPCVVRDMNELSLAVDWDDGLERDVERGFVLEILVRGHDSFPAKRSAGCLGYVMDRRRGPCGDLMVLQYRATTPRSEYMIHQYFLRTSLATPPSVRRSLRSIPIAPVATHVTHDEKRRRTSSAHAAT